MAEPEHSIVIMCVSCNSKYKVPASLIGRRMACKKCGAGIPITECVDADPYPILGRIALDSKLISETQLQEALSLQKSESQSGTQIPLEEILLRTKMVSDENIKKLLIIKTRKLDNQFGAITIKKGFATKEEIDKVLATQAKTYKESGVCRLVGDMLVDEGVLTEDQRTEVLLAQKRFNKVPPSPSSANKTETGSAIRDGNSVKPSASTQNVPEIIFYPNIGQTAVDHKLITEQQLQQAMILQKEKHQKGKEALLEDLLIEAGMISSPLMLKLKTVTTRLLDKEFGLIAVRDDIATQEAVDAALKKQAIEFKEHQTCKMVGDLLIEAGTITKEQRDRILIEQERIKPERGVQADEKPVLPAADKKGNDTIVETTGEKDKEVLTASEKKFWETRKLDKEFCDIAIYRRFVTQDEVDRALDFQIKYFEETRLRKQIGDILMESGFITSEQHNQIMAEQQRLRNKSSKSEDKNRQQQTAKISDTCQLMIFVTNDKLKAFIQINGKLPSDFSVKDLKELLREKGIINGLVEDSLVAGYLKFEGVQSQEFKIAEGKEAIPGRDGAIKYYFDTNPLKVGAIKSGGEIDFKDRGEIPHVQKGDLLAEIIPAINGDAGIDIFGKPLRIPELKEVKLKCDTGITRAKDGLKAYASATGQPKLSMNGTLSVFSDLNIKGDVGFETGHVDFEGNILIQGTIQSGFRVKGGNITAKEIVGAEVEATGDIQIAGGITDSKIKSLGNIKAKYLKNSTVAAYGDIVVEKEVIESTVINNGAFIIQRGKIIASSIASRRGIQSKDIGTEISQPCKLRMGVQDYIETEVERFDMAMEEKKETLNKMQMEKKKLEAAEQKSHKDIAALAQIQDQATVQQRELKAKIQELNKNKGEADQVAKIERLITEIDAKAKKADEEINSLFHKQDNLMKKLLEIQDSIKETESEIKELDEEKQLVIANMIEEKSNASVAVSGTIYEGTMISGPHATLILNKNLKNIQLKEAPKKDPKSDSEYEIISVVRR